MKLEVTCRNVEMSERLHARMERKADKLATHLREPSELHVTLQRERHEVRAELDARGAGQRFHAHASGSTARQAIDAAVSRLLRTMKRSRERNLDHHHGVIDREELYQATA